MLLKNTGSKLINVGSTVLMPGDEKNVPDAFADTPALKTFIRMEYLQIVSESEAPAKVAEEEPKAEEVEKPVEDEKPAEEKKTASRARKTTKKATE